MIHKFGFSQSCELPSIYASNNPLHRYCTTMAHIETLMDMGFERERVEYALKATNNKGVEPAMEWLLAHVGEAIPTPSTAVHIDPAQPQEQSPTEPPSIDPENSPSASTTTADADPEAKSLKCDECNRLFKTQLEVEFHAAKSGHSSFSESTEEKKPLTEEEKVAQLSLLEEKLRQKRLAREQADKQEAQQAEKVRIKMGKEMAEAKRKLEEQEMAKIVEQRRREKEEEKMARDRVRAQIEADKANRKAKMDATSPTAATAPAVVSSPPSHKSPPGSAGPKKDYATTKIQIRLPDGTAVTEEFNAKENLAAVKVFIEINHYDLPFRLMTAYPRKVFDDADLETPLAALGLVPSSVVIVTKGPGGM